MFITLYEKLGNAYSNAYYTLDGELILRTLVENGVIRYEHIETSNAASERGPGWAACAGAVLTQMTDGSVLGSSAAIGCMLFSGYCAAAIGIGCIGYMF